MRLEDLLKEFNVTIPKGTGNIEIPDDFEENTRKFEEDDKIKFICTLEDLKREICIDLSERIISVTFKSDIYSGGEEYSLDGQLIKIMN